jgi:hypothetical protein
MGTFIGYSIAVFALISVSSHADPEQICDDLQRFVCAPGSYDDGTGVASNPTALSSGQTEIEQKITKRAHTQFLKALKDPDNTYFRKSVLSATGLSLAPQCTKAEDKPSTKCLNDMATGLTGIFFKQQDQISQGAAYQSMNNSVTDTTFVTESPIYQDAVQEIMTQTKEMMHAGDIDKKARDKVFPQVKALLLAKIKQMVKDPKVRKNLTDKVKSIRYESSDCSGGGGSNVPGLLMPNAFYNPAQNNFNFCSGMTLQNKSEFLMAFVMAHELSHSIDPCCITQGPSDFSFRFPEGGTRAEAEAAYPIQGVIACLRSDQSIKARAADQVPQIAPGAGGYGGYGNYGNYGNYGGGMGGGIGQSQPQPQTPQPFAGFCQNDQITESFADWMAAEITPEYIAKNYPKLTSEQSRFGYSNIWRGSCMDDATARQIAIADPHPAQGDRSNRIILVQPKIRAQMNCPKMPPRGTVYCRPPGSKNASVPVPEPTPKPDMEGVVK